MAHFASGLRQRCDWPEIPALLAGNPNAVDNLRREEPPPHEGLHLQSGRQNKVGRATAFRFRKIALPGRGTIVYRTSGGGPIPILFVHGYGMSSRVWERIMPLLPARYTGFAYDLRGFGDSQHGGQYDFAHHLRDMQAFLDAMGIERAVVVGHSMGANLLQEFAVANADRLLALVLSNASARVLPPPDPIASRVEERLALFDRTETARQALEIAVPRYFDAINLRPGEVAEWIEIGLKADPAALRAMLAVNYSAVPIPAAAFRSIRAPTLIVTGAHDVFSSSDAMPDAALSIIGACGHAPMWERPQAWMDAVLCLLERTVGLADQANHS